LNREFVVLAAEMGEGYKRCVLCGAMGGEGYFLEPESEDDYTLLERKVNDVTAFIGPCHSHLTLSKIVEAIEELPDFQLSSTRDDAIPYPISSDKPFKAEDITRFKLRFAEHLRDHKAQVVEAKTSTNHLCAFCEDRVTSNYIIQIGDSEWHVTCWLRTVEPNQHFLW
jgi:hypothetical protein